jgi:hypothetical protein
VFVVVSVSKCCIRQKPPVVRSKMCKIFNVCCVGIYRNSKECSYFGVSNSVVFFFSFVCVRQKPSLIKSKMCKIFNVCCVGIYRNSKECSDFRVSNSTLFFLHFCKFCLAKVEFTGQYAHLLFIFLVSYRSLFLRSEYFVGSIFSGQTCYLVMGILVSVYSWCLCKQQ